MAWPCRSPGLPVAILVVVWTALLLPVFPFLKLWPAEWVVPAKDWITVAFAWFASSPSPSPAPSPGCLPSHWRLSRHCSFAACLRSEMAPASVDRDRWPAQQSSPLGGRAGACGLLTGLCSFSSGDLRPVGRRHADARPRHRRGPLRGGARPRLGHMGNANARVENMS